MEQLKIKDFLLLDIPLLDTRSPAEYDQGHIASAFSFPLFTNEERAQVGTTYKQEGQKCAIKLGLSIVGLKMVSFIEKAEQYKSDKLRIHCWRGGMRSSSMAWLLEQYGFEVFVLAGGYKAYRNHIIEKFKTPLQLKVLTGLTGSGKTEVLKAMSALGAQVIDLEGLANHPGSSFGNQLQLPQPTTEMFQNMIFHQLDAFDPQLPIWIEDESFCIGQVHLPEDLFFQMRESPRYELDLPLEVRQSHLVDQYGKMKKERLIAATQAIQKKLGGAETTRAIELIEAGQLFEASGIILTYYDRIYNKNMNKTDQPKSVKVGSDNLDFTSIAKRVMEQHGN